MANHLGMKGTLKGLRIFLNKGAGSKNVVFHNVKTTTKNPYFLLQISHEGKILAKSSMFGLVR